MNVKVFDAPYLDDLVSQALASPRCRQHRNIHEDYADPCQRTFNAIEPESYLRPHRHGPAQGPETMLAVRGLMALILFADDGRITDVHRFGAGAHAAANGVAAGVETPPGRWHSVVSLEHGSILLEVKAGPFDPTSPRFPAPWAPEEGSVSASQYLAELVTKIKLR
ncbi:MAG TPA: WbuC family cupin fold metalloprotein [Rhodanobacter sp.]|nr:WbuC family cupin fold metalloprotein [Rhodanobacter sp.]